MARVCALARARSAQRLPAHPDPARPAQARHLPAAHLEALHARYLKSIHADIERIGKQIVGQLLQKSGPGEYGECDFVKEVSAPLPIAVIAWLLGVPESDWNLLFDWTNRTIGAGDPEYQQPGKTPQESAMAAMTELFGYFAKLVEEKRKKPGDDLVSLFAHLEVDGQRIPEMDVLTFCLIIVVAGNETTRNGTTGGMLAFIEHPDEMRKLVRNPKLIDAAVEEVVRWVSPLIHFGRTATVDFELRARRSGRATHSRCSTRPPIATRKSSRTATCSVSTAIRITTSASASASTSASARTSRASSWRSPTSTCCRASRRSRSPARSNGSPRRWSAA